MRVIAASQGLSLPRRPSDHLGGGSGNTTCPICLWSTPSTVMGRFVFAMGLTEFCQGQISIPIEQIFPRHRASAFRLTSRREARRKRFGFGPVASARCRPPLCVSFSLLSDSFLFVYTACSGPCEAKTTRIIPHPMADNKPGSREVEVLRYTFSDQARKEERTT